MYGLLLENLAAFVRIQWGENKWDSIRRLAGVDAPSFSVHHVYAETLIPRLARCAVQVLDVTEQEFFEAMGVYFVEFVGQYGYDQVLSVLGRHMRDFLNGLDNLHEYLKFSYPRMRAPSFFCENETAGGLTLHYRSKRRGYVYYTMGQIKQVARHFYKQDCGIELSSEALDGDTMHVTFQLTFDNRAFCEAESIMSIIREEQQLPVRASLLFEIFPFCLAFCPDMVIRYTGHALLTILKDLVGQCVSQAFDLVRPLIGLTFSNKLCKVHCFNQNYVSCILERRNNIFELVATAPLNDDESINEVEDNDNGGSLRIKGQMKYMESWTMILFLATPVLPDLDSLITTELYLNDLSLHDCSRDLVLAGTQQSVELKLALDQEQQKSRKLEESMRKLDDEMRRTDDLLYQMIPKQVADRIRRGENPVDTCEVFDSVSILFSDVVTFTDICSRITPMQVVSMLNHMYLLFDQLTERNGVYKVETIGDAYMVVSGAPNKDLNHCDRICDMALDMIDASAGIKDPSGVLEHVRLRVGVHSGSVVGGVVGLKMPRYCLFGDAVNTASRMESTSEAGKVQISESTKEQIPSTYQVEYRGTVTVKGKGEMNTYWLTGRRERIPLAELRCNSFSWDAPTLNLNLKSSDSSPAVESAPPLLRSTSVASSMNSTLKGKDEGRDGRSNRAMGGRSETFNPLLTHQTTIEVGSLDAAKDACSTFLALKNSQKKVEKPPPATPSPVTATAPSVTFAETPVATTAPVSVPVPAEMSSVPAGQLSTPVPVPVPVPAPAPVSAPQAVPAPPKLLSVTKALSQSRSVPPAPALGTEVVRRPSQEKIMPDTTDVIKNAEPPSKTPLLVKSGDVNQTQENFLLSKATLNNGTVPPSGRSEERKSRRDPMLNRMRDNKVALLTSEAMARMGCSGFGARPKEVASEACNLL